MRQLFLFMMTIGIFGGCAFDNMFLFPYELSNQSKVSKYSTAYNDTISVTFDETQPHFTDSKNETLETNYTISSLNFLNRKQDTLNAWLIEPKEDFNGQILYFLHGNAGNVLYQYSLAIPFVNRGYKVFLIDYSGFGFSGGETSRKNVLTDAYDGFEYLKKMDNVAPNGIIIYGQSLGGHLAVVVAKKYQEDIKGIVAEGAFSSHRRVASTRVPLLPYVFMKEQYSAKDSIEYITKPTLIVHSISDETVKYKLGKILYKNASEPKQFYPIDSCHVCGPLYFPDGIVARMNVMK